jgi:Aspartyl protease
MKVGNNRIQLAWAYIAHLRANNYFSFLITCQLLAINLWGINPKIGTPIHLPIHFVGKSVFVEATVNSKTGYYLFDSGAPNLILNSQYFQDDDAMFIESDLLGFNGEALTTKSLWTQDFSLGGISLENNYALLLDLSTMERIKHIRIDGIIGYEVIKNMVWKIDFDRKELQMMPSVAKHPISWPCNLPPTDSVDLYFSGHIPYIIINLSGKRLRMGIDTGSERNLLQDKLIKPASFQQRGLLKLAGLTAEVQRLRVGFVSDFSMGNLQADSLEVVLADLRQVSDELPTRLDGLLGISFLKDHHIAINYQQGKLYFWRQPTEQKTTGMYTCAIGD